MKKLFPLLWATVCLLCCISCSKDDPLIDNSSNEWTLITASGEGLNSLSRIEYPGGQTSDFILPAGTSNGKITKLAAFGNKLFAMCPDDYAVFVFDIHSYEFLKKIDFSQEALEPCGIAFANSTDAYIIFRNSSKIAVYDLYGDTGYYSRSIEIGHIPSDIVFTTNNGTVGYIVTANTADNCLSVIDAGTYSKLRDIETEAAPAFLAAYSDKNALLAVCLGEGKTDLDSGKTKTSGYATVLNTATWEVVVSKEISYYSKAGSEITPTGIAINNSGLCIISSDYGLFKVNLKMAVPTLIKSVKGNYTGIAMLYGTQQPLVMTGDDNNNNSLYILDASTLKQEEEITIPFNFGTFLAI